MQHHEAPVVAERLVAALRQPAALPEKPAAPVSMTGLWDVGIDFHASRGRHQLAITDQSGALISGVHVSNLASHPLRGQVSGTAVRIESIDQSLADRISFVFDGRVEGETMIGTLYMGEYGQATFAAHRCEPAHAASRIGIPRHGRRTGGAW